MAGAWAYPSMRGMRLRSVNEVEAGEYWMAVRRKGGQE